MRKLVVEDLALVNLILDLNPDLADQIQKRAEVLAGGLFGLGKNQAPTPPTNGNGHLEDKVVAWFKAHPGKHHLGEARKDLGVAQDDKAFKTAVGNAQAKGRIVGTGKRGLGALFWAAP